MLAASKSLRSNASLVLDGMVTDYERASGPWHIEWIVIPELFVMAIGALNQASFVLSRLDVNKDSMTINLYSTKDLIVGEAVMMGLAPFVGHDVVCQACKQAIEEKLTLQEGLKGVPEVTDKIPEKKREELCDSIYYYLGSCREMVNHSCLILGHR